MTREPALATIFILMPASRTYPVDKTPMHETEGDDCRCFERKEG